jgi:hypothetical protein
MDGGGSSNTNFSIANWQPAIGNHQSAMKT